MYIACADRRLSELLQSKKGAELIYKYPILLDACANEMQVLHWKTHAQTAASAAPIVKRAHDVALHLVKATARP